MERIDEVIRRLGELYKFHRQISRYAAEKRRIELLLEYENGDAERLSSITEEMADAPLERVE